MEKLLLADIVENVLNQMQTSGFAESTRKLYAQVYKRLSRLAEKQGELYYSIELGQAFINDTSHIIPENTTRYHHERTVQYIRCIRYIESFIKDGVVDWTPAFPYHSFPIKSEKLQSNFIHFEQTMHELGLKPNTIDGYRRFSYYFLEYLESKGYTSLQNIKRGDVVAFIAVICTEKYQATSLGAHMPGLKLFLNCFDETKSLLVDIPEHLPKKRDILKVYSDEEYEKIVSYVNQAEDMSFRNKAITIIALDTGLRAVDICALKLSNIDWEHNMIHFSQQKTGRIHNIPLTEQIGNALVDYLLNERPVSSSEYVFLQNKAPYGPLMAHSAIRGILFNVVNDADVQGNGRIYGTRITRHSAASRMLRHGVPLSVISESLGHGNPNSVMIYITTDDAKLAECTLPLPGRRCLK